MKDCRFKDDSHTKCWCSIAKLDYQRVTEIPPNKNIQFMTRTSTCCGVHEEVQHVYMYVVVISIYYIKSQKLWLWWSNHNFWGICLYCFVFLVVVVAVAVDVAVTLAVAAAVAAAAVAAAVAAVLVAESPIVLFSYPPSTICILAEAEGKRFHVLRSKKKRTRMGGAFIRCKSNQLQF